MHRLMFAASKGIHPEVEAYLKNEFKIIQVPLNVKCYQRIAHHVDIQLLRIDAQIFMDEYTFGILKDTLLCLEDAFINVEEQQIYFKGYTFHCIRSSLGNKYPQSVVFNGKWMGSVFIHNMNYTDKNVLKFLETTKINKIHTKQGYTGCSLLLLNDNVGITSDSGLARDLTNHGFDILLINPGYIELNGFEYGFIGGASFVDKGKVIFNGDLDNHIDSKKIRAFINSHQLEIVNFKNRPLVDVGSFIILD